MSTRRTIVLSVVGVLVAAVAGLAIKGDSTLTVRVSGDIAAPVGTTWRLFGEEFGEVSTWARAFESSSLDGPLAAGVMRTIELNADGGIAGTITQELTEFDRDARVLTYEMRTGMPAMLTGISNRWTFSDAPDGGTRADGLATFELAWWAWPLTPMIRGKMTGTLESFIGELRTHAERTHGGGRLTGR